MWKQILKKSRFLLLLITAAWILVAIQWFSKALFRLDTSMASAFSQTEAMAAQSILEVTAKYKNEMLTDFDRKQMIYHIAGRIGLEVTGELYQADTETRSEISYTKEAYAATTSLRTISILKENGENAAVEHYFHVRIKLTNSLDVTTAYKELVETVLEESGYGEISTTIQLIGQYEGYLTVDRRDKITDEILSAMGGKIAYEHRENDLYTVYAYTGLIEEYITVEGKKINLHIAMSKDEENYRTIVYFASPILPDTW